MKTAKITFVILLIPILSLSQNSNVQTAIDQVRNDGYSKAYTVVDEGGGYINDETVLISDITIFYPGEYYIAAIVDCTYCQVEIVIFNYDTNKVSRNSPKMQRNNGISATSGRFDPSSSNYGGGSFNGEINISVKGSTKYYTYAMIFKK